MTSSADSRHTAPDGGLRAVLTQVARLVVAEHVAPHLPDGHPWRAWSTPDVAAPRPWPASELWPACTVSVAAPPVPALDVFAAGAAAEGLRVARSVGPDGWPVCTVTAPRLDGDELLLETTGVVGRRLLGRIMGSATVPAPDFLGGWPFPLPVARVTAYPVDGGGCVLDIRVEHVGTPHRALRRRLPVVLSRFVTESAAHGVAVMIGPWGRYRGPHTVHLGRRSRTRRAA